MEKPEFGRVHSVPMGFLPRFQQKQYRGRRAACAIGRLDPPGLALPAAFRLGLQVQPRSEEHTSELQVPNAHLVCRLLLEKKKEDYRNTHTTLPTVKRNLLIKNKK